MLGLLGLLGLAAGSPVPAAAPTAAEATTAHSTIAQCAQRAGATIRSLDALRSACPGIDGAAGELALRRSASRLRAIAVGLKPPPPPPTLWEQIVAWIRNWLRAQGEGSSSWMRFLPHWGIGPGLARVLFVILAGLIVITVGVFVAIELRAAGLIGAGRRPRMATRRSSAGRLTTEVPSSGFAEVDSAPPHERPALLLKLLVQALTRSNRLGHERDLTCRELIARARFDTGRQRASFGLVALLAERALYGGPLAAASAAPPDEVLSAARTLYDELLSTPAAGAPATTAAEAA